MSAADPGPEQWVGPRQTLGTGRMEALSDGVFAFAMTLLVVNLAVPPDHLLHQLLRTWPTFLAYVVSFFTIGAGWMAHTALTDRLDRVDQMFLKLNLLVLLAVGFLPLPTRLVASTLHSPSNERVAVTVYGATLVAIRILGFALDTYARREHLYRTGREGEELRREGRQLLPVLGGYAVAIAVGIAAPQVAVALYFAITVYLFFPLRVIGRYLSHRSTGS